MGHGIVNLSEEGGETVKTVNRICTKATPIGVLKGTQEVQINQKGVVVSQGECILSKEDQEKVSEKQVAMNDKSASLFEAKK